MIWPPYQMIWPPYAGNNIPFNVSCFIVDMTLLDFFAQQNRIWLGREIGVDHGQGSKCIKVYSTTETVDTVTSSQILAQGDWSELECNSCLDFFGCMHRLTDLTDSAPTDLQAGVSRQYCYLELSSSLRELLNKSNLF